ncbi:Uncharacterized protein BP5553_09422 [Venustampulla echinocandica]|uniref:Uncharacterized protein n=1 Tax=Venustampulla echinocandica TaxID=2656787 RepID=A0A370TCN4_9HELO|nr:Uncharacterized protein BP5553_09422 [Venustampulla echinocandica]RDL32020.1 Uncharacterized protein BP5553_09422 [Venustampulla echinocandica]
MPHKHTRKGEVDKSKLDLPPTVVAKPLPVSKSANENGIFTSDLTATRRTNKKRKRNTDAADDTPKAFARLMAFTQGRKLPKGLDDGVKISTKKAKKGGAVTTSQGEESGNGGGNAKEANPEVLAIKPGERMSEFSARVNAALPVSGLINKTGGAGKDPLGLKVGRTKTEKKMHRMYADWREEERRIQEKRDEARELEEMEEEGSDGQVVWKEEGSEATKKKKGKKGKKRKLLVGEIGDAEEDPWAKIKRDRGEEKIGLNDVVKAPPVFTKPPKEKFKVRGAMVEVDNVPKASGSLRRREELCAVRQSVVEGYRQMMRDNKARMRNKEDK